ncbi:MAG: HAD family hydrolase [Anaerolineales bacterium]|nr:HAD family hydrolase [Anaerolineales bacterium]
MQDKRIQAVLFDFDDTLVDWSQRADVGGKIYRRHVANVYAHLAAQGVPLPEEAQFFRVYRDVISEAWDEAKKSWAGVNFAVTWMATLEQLGVDTAVLDLDAVWRAFDWQPVPGVRPYPDTLATLRALRQAGYRLGLITNSMMPMWMRDVELQAYGMLSFFDARITSGDAGVMKPHPDIYQAILRQLRVPPERAVFVGDRPANDIAGANAVGMTSVLMAPPHVTYPLDGVQPDFTITTLTELLPILAELEVSHAEAGTK